MSALPLFPVFLTYFGMVGVVDGHIHTTFTQDVLVCVIDTASIATMVSIGNCKSHVNVHYTPTAHQQKWKSSTLGIFGGVGGII